VPKQRLAHGTAISTDPQERSAYAPYWYIDKSTDSYVEIKNHLNAPLSLSPVLTLMTDHSVKLRVITVPPFSTARVSLRSQPELRKLRSSAVGKAARWGDGSRSGSQLGGAKLTPIHPKGAAATAFSAWVLVEDPDERLGTVSLFEVPAEAINTVLAGLWWLPYPDTQAYYALQNTSSIAVNVGIELVAEGKSIRTASLRLPAFGMRLINVRELLQNQNAPPVGGIRITYKSEGGRRTLPGQVVGRGRLFEERIGFSASLMLHEYLGNPPSDGVSELHAPAAYFGKLAALSGRSKAYLHPHLLLWNTRPYDIIFNPIVYGRTKNGKAVEWRMPSVFLKTASPVEIDLEKQRQAASIELEDGPAGLRMLHTGSPTDVVAELINVDEEGKVVFYDAVRSTPYLHGPATQAAISFNLLDRNQSFLILKNVSDFPQPITIFLDYADGKGHYELKPELVAPQQDRIIDIRSLRDKQISGKNGVTLPRELGNGGSFLLSEPGAFVVSDPTFIYTTPKPSVGNLDPEPDPDGPDDLFDRPFFLPSCARTGPPDCQPPRCTPPPPSYPRSPFPTPCNVSTPWSQTHRAIDVSSSTNRFGEEVDAMEGGTIESVGTRPAGDDDFSAVVIRGDDGFLTIYGHVRPSDGLARGQPVQAGQRIGSTDNSGKFQLPSGGFGPCPDPAGRNCSHVHIARIKANLPLPNREVLSEILPRIRPREKGGMGEGDFFGIDCTSPQRLSRALGLWPYVHD